MEEVAEVEAAEAQEYQPQHPREEQTLEINLLAIRHSFLQETGPSPKHS